MACSKPGLLYVTVLKGVDLAVRDFTSSDPYVVLKLGKETHTTNIKRRELNPVWNETFAFKAPEVFNGACQALEVGVWDKDALTKDDSMGYGLVSLSRVINGGEMVRIHSGSGRRSQDVCINLKPTLESVRSFDCIPDNELGSLHLRLHYTPFSNAAAAAAALY